MGCVFSSEPPAFAGVLLKVNQSGPLNCFPCGKMNPVFNESLQEELDKKNVTFTLKKLGGSGMMWTLHFSPVYQRWYLGQLKPQEMVDMLQGM